MIPLPLASSFLFDFDGTLVDSSPLHDRAFRGALAEYAPRFLVSFNYDTAKGKTTHDAFLAMGIEDSELVANLTAVKQRLFRSSVQQGMLEPITGARELLASLREGGHALYVVTSGSRGSVTMSLEAIGLAAFFAGVITSDDVARSKPDPDPFLTCLARFALARDAAVVVEDAPSGIASARAAGLLVIGVNNPAVACLADLYFPTLRDLTNWALNQRDRQGLVA